MEFLLIKGEDRDREVKMIEADNREEAKEVYAMYLFENDDYLVESMEDKTVNCSFWEQFFIDAFDELGRIKYEADEDIFKLLKANLMAKFEPEVAEELYDFYHQQKDYKPGIFNPETRLAVGMTELEEMLECGFAELMKLEDIDRIN